MGAEKKSVENPMFHLHPYIYRTADIKGEQTASHR
jgi:hypothetical protein